MSEINNPHTTAPTRSDVRHIDTAPSATAPVAAEQLTLLAVEPDKRAHELPTRAEPRREVHARFQLSRQTRERGLRHIAEIRRQLEDAKATRNDGDTLRDSPRRPAA